MDFLTAVVAIVAIGGSFAFVTAIVKMSMDHKIRLEKIRHGYPVESVDGGAPRVKLVIDDETDYEKEYRGERLQ